VDGCRNNAERAGLCSAHRRRRRLKLPGDTLRHYGQSSRERLQRAAVEYSDACSEDEAHYRRADYVLEKASDHRTLKKVQAALARGEDPSEVAVRWGFPAGTRVTLPASASPPEHFPVSPETPARVGHPGQEQAGEGRGGDA
jgi:hypothetical protein